MKVVPGRWRGRRVYVPAPEQEDPAPVCNLCGGDHYPDACTRIRTRELRPQSDQYTWIFKPVPGNEKETFDVGVFHFNINRAKRIIHLAPRPVVMVALAPYAALLEMFVDLDHGDEAGRQYHLDFPIILATLKRGGTIPIDGWHRINKALKEGRKELPGVFLTIEETKVVRRK